jgi:hypothetical protein
MEQHSNAINELQETPGFEVEVMQVLVIMKLMQFCLK